MTSWSCTSSRWTPCRGLLSLDALSENKIEERENERENERRSEERRVGKEC